VGLGVCESVGLAWTCGSGYGYTGVWWVWCLTWLRRLWESPPGGCGTRTWRSSRWSRCTRCAPGGGSPETTRDPRGRRAPPLGGRRDPQSSAGGTRPDTTNGGVREEKIILGWVVSGEDAMLGGKGNWFPREKEERDSLCNPSPPRSQVSYIYFVSSIVFCIG
jgi:hypothetical protein